jgi:predicted small lipoprotein YifL
MVPRQLGNFDVNRVTSPSRWALLVIAAAALALAGCGRKAGLDLPPGAADVPSAAPASQPAAKGDVFDSSYGTNAPPSASKGQKRRIILDPLLD